MRGFIGQNEFLLQAFFFSESMTKSSPNTDIFGQSVKIQINILILDFRNFFLNEEEMDLNAKQITLARRLIMVQI